MSKTSKTMNRKEILIANLSKEGKDKALIKIERIIEDDAEFYKDEIKKTEKELKVIERSIEDFIGSYTPMCNEVLTLVQQKATLKARLTLIINTKEIYE